LSTVVAKPPVKPAANGAAAASAAAPTAVEFRYSQSDSFVDLLRQLGASLAITTYQANKLLVARVAGQDCRPWSAPSTARWGWQWALIGWR